MFYGRDGLFEADAEMESPHNNPIVCKFADRLRRTGNRTINSSCGECKKTPYVF
jgi:hypothetical protein